MKTILVTIGSTKTLCMEEALNAAMVLASFDNQVTVALGEAAACELEQPTSKVAKLIASFEFYDLAPPVSISELDDHADFDHVFTL